MRNSSLQEKFNFCFSGNFYHHWQNFYFGRGTKHKATILWNLEIFLIFPNFLSLVVGQLVNSLVYTSLLLIITLRFTCGESKICSTIKKSQNIMNMIVVVKLQSLCRTGLYNSTESCTICSQQLHLAHARTHAGAPSKPCFHCYYYYFQKNSYNSSLHIRYHQNFTALGSQHGHTKYACTVGER